MRLHFVRALVLAVVSLGVAACGGGGVGGQQQPPVPASIAIVSGNNQAGVAGSALPAPLSVSVKDSSGRGIQGASVSWAVVAGGGSVTPETSTTDRAGLATTNWTLGAALDANRVTATSGMLPPVAFDATGVAGPAASVSIVSGNGQSGSVGTELPAALTVRVTDSGSRPVSGVTVSWAVTAGGGTVTPTTGTTDSSGAANTRWTLGAAAGPQRATATVAGVVSATFDATATAVPVVLTSIAVTGAPGAPMTPGGSAQLSAIATYSDQSTKVVTTDVAWSTTDTTILSVTAVGMLSANEPGQAVVIATLSGISGSVSVEVVPLQVSDYELRLTGDAEIMIAAGQFGLIYTPDEHITFRRTASGVDLWLSAGSTYTQGGTFRLRGTSFESLAPDPSAEGNAIPVFVASGSGGFDADYAGGTSIFTAANGTDLLMVYHAENHNCPNAEDWAAGIGLARSSDGGRTWTREGQIVSSSYQPQPCTAGRLHGAGNPVVVMTRERDYYYMYFSEWLPDQYDEIRMARSPVGADAVPSSWKKYYRGEFNEPGLGGRSDPVIHGAGAEGFGFYAVFPSVSYNSVLQRYLAVFQAPTTMQYTASKDGIHWEPARGIGPPVGSPEPVGEWFCYPSLLSLDELNDMTTNERGYLYYSHGIHNVTPHYMERRPYELVIGGSP